ncbi:NAD(P)H-dependent amine dehydrogenase family protein [Aeromicrobium sp.]|uniref:NAD(P)H-dependent amine dehydrogenase family protein n=1 Tax=Aeromicrobium sp. TaxID=1871063 RepID=UPI002FC6BEC6
MSISVAAWSTGNVGKHVLAGIDARPDLELVGLWVSNPDKVGKDAGRLAGLDRDLGVLATNDVEAIIALKPDCVVHSAMADDRLFEAMADLERLLRAGINVVSSGPVFLQYPAGPAVGMAEGVQQAGKDGGASLYVNGIDPGFANDWLPLSLTSISERIDEVRCSEVLNYNTYNQGMIVFDVMGFGKPMDNIPMLLEPGILSLAWGSVVHQIAAGLGVELDDVEEFYERLPATESFDIDSGRIEKGTVAGLRFEVRGMVGGKAVVVLEHVTRVHDDIGPDWPQPAGKGCYRVEIKGEPNYTLDLQLLGTDGDHNTAGLKATAMRLVNAIPAVVDAKPGLVTTLDLPLVTGRGLVVS